MIVTIIIPYFKDPNNIESAIKSAEEQTYKKKEIIIIDDEKSNHSKKILIKLKKKFKKIKIFSSLKSSGVSGARNLGIKKARGDLIAFLDSDDLWKKEKIKKQIIQIKKFNADICYTNFIAKNENNKTLYKVEIPTQLYYSDLLKECPIACSSVVLKKEILKNIKFKKLYTKEDYMLWLDLSKKGHKFIGVNKYLTIYKVRPKTLSSKHINKLYSAFMIYSYYLRFNFLISIIFVVRLYFKAFIKKYIN